ncbi:MAG TPA: hypothetical protein VGI63_06200 [Verrucomicrobiae bacterium]|jgi:hypothetical protein
MKIFFVTVIGLAGLMMPRTSYAAPSAPASKHPSSESPKVSVQPPDAKRGNQQDKTINKDTAPVRPNAAAIGGPASPAKNTAVVTGKSAKANQNTAIVNGTAINRKTH